MSAADAVATAAAGAAPAVPADAPDAEEDATLGLPAEQVAKYTVATTFRGAAVELLQVPRARGDDGADITGWAAWEASNVLLRWVADDGHLRRALGGGGDGDGTRDAPPPCPPWSSLSVLDLSAGAGLVALAAAAAGARAVAACDIHPQLPQLVGNLRRGDLAVDEVVTPTPLGGAAPAKPPSVRRWAPIRRGDSSSGNDGRRPSAAPAVRVVPFWWGQPLDALRPPLQDDGGATPEEAERLWYDVVLVSDILFIALRDKLGDMLAHTIRGLAARCRCVCARGRDVQDRHTTHDTPHASNRTRACPPDCSPLPAGAFCLYTRSACATRSRRGWRRWDCHPRQRGNT